MKPFNLEQALAGKPVVTRDGREVTQLHLFDCNKFPLVCVIGGYTTTMTKTGTENIGVSSDNDLFMASEKVIKWVNIYKGNFCSPYLYDSKEEAIKGSIDHDLITTTSITFEI